MATDSGLQMIESLSAAKTRAEMQVRSLVDAVNDLARICEAVRYTAGLGQGQIDRVTAARKAAADALDKIGRAS